MSQLGDPLDDAVAAMHKDLKDLIAGFKEVHRAVYFIAQNLQAILTRGTPLSMQQTPPKQPSATSTGQTA